MTEKVLYEKDMRLHGKISSKNTFIFFKVCYNSKRYQVQIQIWYVRKELFMNNNHRNNRNTAPRNNQENTKNSYNKINTERGDTLIYAMGGLGEVGKNMYCFEHENEILIIDSGVRFPEENLLGVDYVIPDYNYLVKNNRKRKILVITHGHEDHIGDRRDPVFVKKRGY